MLNGNFDERNVGLGIDNTYARLQQRPARAMLGPAHGNGRRAGDAHVEDLILTVRARRLMKEIRRLRTAAGLTVARAAKQLEISEATLWRMENGKTRISTEVLVAMLDPDDVRSPQREAPGRPRH